MHYDPRNCKQARKTNCTEHTIIEHLFEWADPYYFPLTENKTYENIPKNGIPLPFNYNYSTNKSEVLRCYDFIPHNNYS